MRYLKNVIKIMGVVGFVVIFGTVGYSDYQNSIGEYVPFTELVVRLIIGFALLTPSIIMLMCGDKRGK